MGEIDRLHFSGIFWVILHNCLTKYFINWVDSTQMWCLVLTARTDTEKCLTPTLRAEFRDSSHMGNLKKGVKRLVTKLEIGGATSELKKVICNRVSIF